MTKHVIKVCMGSSCFARGNLDNLSFLENYIKENNLDTEIELIGGLCTEKCASGPNIFIDGEHYGEVNLEKLEQILSEINATANN